MTIALAAIALVVALVSLGLSVYLLIQVRKLRRAIREIVGVH